MDQSGKTNLPFATADGKPITPDAEGTPKDLVKDPNGGQPKDGSFDVTSQNRQQPTEQGQPPTPPWLANRPQQAGSPSQRVNAISIPKGGLVPPTPTQQPTTQSRVPFKVK